MKYSENVESQSDRIAAVRHPNKVERWPGKIPDVRHSGGMSKNSRPGGMSYAAQGELSACARCRDPSPR